MRMIHIAAGVLALAAGAVALYATKGSILHRRSGLVFAAAMLTMTSSAVVIAAFLRPDAVNVVAGVLTFYLVTTGLLTVRDIAEHTRALTTGLMLAALTASAFAFGLAFEAMRGADGAVEGIPAPPLLMFGAVGVIGALGDARSLRAGRLQGTRRLARHLWRMSFAMFIATASFFLGQAKVFPEPLRKPALLAAPVVLVLLVMLYWLVRVRLRVRARRAA